MEVTAKIAPYTLNEEEEKKKILREYRALLRVLKAKLKPGDKVLLRRAFEMAAEAHKTMRRKSGEPYILHPLAVAKICVEEIGLGIRSTICALLHDTVEDTDVSLEDVRLEFGNEIAKIVDGLTKISTVMDSNSSQQAENFKKILLTLTDDPRVILIKLADRLHNMRTLDSMKPEKQLKVSSETIYVYAPLAHRMGLYNIKTEMEDLAMIRKAESIQDELWSLVAQWNNFAKDTIGKQLVRAADSIGANMAESYGRFNYGEKIQFLYYARGSLFETKYWLNRALSRNLIGLADHEAYASALSDIARQINSFVGHLKTKRGQSSKPSAREEQAPYRLDQFEEATDLVFSEDDLGFLGHF